MCSCTSCSNTDKLSGWISTPEGRKPNPAKGGFASWPKGDPAGPRGSARDYAAHVAHSFYGAKKRVDFGPAGAGFYGTPAGMTRAEVDAVLRASFKPEPEAAPVEIQTGPRLLAMAREMRQARMAEEKAQRKQAREQHRRAA